MCSRVSKKWNTHCSHLDPVDIFFFILCQTRPESLDPTVYLGWSLSQLLSWSDGLELQCLSMWCWNVYIDMD